MDQHTLCKTVEKQVPALLEASVITVRGYDACY